MGKLSEAIIRAAEPPERGQRLIFDDHRDAPRGFGLRITRAGGKSFVLRYTADGVERRKTLGEWPTWSLAAARQEAQALRRRIDRGEDVLEIERAARRELTVAEAAARYCERHAAGLRSGAVIRRYFDRDVVPALGRQKLKAVRRADLIRLVEDKAADAPRAAALLLVHLKGLFAWAEDRELIEANPAAGIRPGKLNRALKPRARARVLDDAEIRQLWACAETCGLHRLTALALKLVLLTGQRPGEVAGMRWDELDGDTWTIPAARRLKTETEHTVPLPATALQLIEAAREEVQRLGRRRRGWNDGGYVFATRNGSSLTVGALDRGVSRYRAALGNRDHAGAGHWTPHDLRRTCRTGLSAAGVPEEIAERVIGHRHQGIVATYNQHRYDAEKREALVDWERRLLQIVRGTA